MKREQKSRKENERRLLQIGENLINNGEARHGRAFIKLGKQISAQKVRYNNWKAVIKIDADICKELDKIESDSDIWNNNFFRLIGTYYSTLSNQVNKRGVETYNKRIRFWQRREEVSDNESSLRSVLKLEKEISDLNEELKIPNLKDMEIEVINTEIAQNKGLLVDAKRAYIIAVKAAGIDKSTQEYNKIRATLDTDSLTKTVALHQMAIDVVRGTLNENEILIDIANENYISTSSETNDEQYEDPANITNKKNYTK